MAQPKPDLTIDILIKEANLFSTRESTYDEPVLYAVTDGKAVGTYLEHKFTSHLMELYSFAGGNSALGIDIPSVDVDIKVTSIKQPQSSCPFKSARQKVYGLGYHLIVFVYEKTDDHVNRTGRLNMKHTVFVEKSRTGDYQTTKGIRDILERDGNEDDLVAYLQERNLPLDEIGAQNLAEELLKSKPNLGYLTISNALQWRLQYGRVIQYAGTVEGLQRIS